jgi:P4 family phage/plasmid primase-like protien
MAFLGVPANYTADERGTAQRIADEWGHCLAWSEEMNKWMVRREGRSIWQVDNLVERTSKGMQTCERQRAENQDAAGLTRLQHMRSALELAKPLLAVELCEFDLNPWALNTPDGLINLQTGLYVDNSLVTGRYMMSCRVSPGGGCPLWDSHLWKMCKGDVELIGYLKRLAGMTLIGDQNLKPHVSPQLNGLGRNGKGVFLQGLGWALGDYAQFASTRLLTTTENAHTTEQAGLRGMRLVVVEEVKRINSSLLKDLTGGGVMRARRMRMDDEEFLKSWTLWFNNNGPMMFSGDTSDGLWQRVPRVDLGEGIPVSERIDDMAERMKKEASGILQWMLDGLAEFRAVGLRTPARVQQDSNISRADADPVMTFIRERYELVDDNDGWGEGSRGIVASEFMRDLTEWAKATGEVAVGGRRAVYDEIRARTPLKIEVGSGNKTYIRGLKKRPVDLNSLGSEFGGLRWEDGNDRN